MHIFAIFPVPGVFLSQKSPLHTTHSPASPAPILSLALRFTLSVTFSAEIFLVCNTHLPPPRTLKLHMNLLVLLLWFVFLFCISSLTLSRRFPYCLQGHGFFLSCNFHSASCNSHFAAQLSDTKKHSLDSTMNEFHLLPLNMKGNFTNKQKDAFSLTVICGLYHRQQIY